MVRAVMFSSFRDGPPELGFTRVQQYHLSESATADLEGQDADFRDSGFDARASPRNDIPIFIEDAAARPASSDDLFPRPALLAASPYAPLRPSGARAAGCGRPPGSSRSFHAFSRSARCHGAAFRQPKPAGADRLHLGDFCQRAAAVFGATLVHQDGAAAARRVGRGCGRVDWVVSRSRSLPACPFPITHSETLTRWIQGAV